MGEQSGIGGIDPAPEMEWEVLSANERDCYYLAWGRHEPAAFLAALEEFRPDYADEYAEPGDVKHGYWCVAGEDADGDPGYIECTADSPGARDATWVFIDE